MSYLDRAALDVLAQAADVGLRETLGVALGAFDPLLRGAIRRRVDRALEIAEGRTTRTAHEHVLRVAFLLAHPRAPKDLACDDPSVVERTFGELAASHLPPRKAARPDEGRGAYREAAADRAPVSDADPLPRERRRRFWPATTGLAFASVSAAAIAVGVAVVPGLLPTPRESFEKTPLGHALVDDLTTIVANAGEAGDPTEVDAANARMSSVAVKRQAGDEAVSAIGEALEAVSQTAGSRAEQPDEAAAPLFRAVNRANEAFAAKKIPALLHGYAVGSAGRYRVWLTAHFVERRQALDVGGFEVRVAWTRRLDRLNLADSALYKGAHERWVVHSRDEVDAELVEGLLPALASRAALPLGAMRTPDVRAPKPPTLTGEAAARAVRAELALPAGAASELLDRIDERNQALSAFDAIRQSVGATWRIDLGSALTHSLEETVRQGAALRSPAANILTRQERVKIAARAVEPVARALAELRAEQFAARLEEESRKDGAGEALTPRGKAIACADLATVARAGPRTFSALYLMVRRAHGYSMNAEVRASRELVTSLLLAVASSGPAGEASAHFDDVHLAALFELDRARLLAAARRAHELDCGRPPPPVSAHDL